MKTIQFIIIISLVLGIGLASVHHTAFAQDGVKLVADEDNDIGRQMSVDLSGDTMIIGSPSSSFVKIFAGTDKKWEEQAELVPRHEGGVGSAVSVSGNTAVIGVPGDDEGAEDTGSAFIFVRSGKRWNQRAKLTAADREADDKFGLSVSVDRNTVIVGAPGDDDAGKGAGAAYVFFRNGAIWRQQAKLLPQDLTGSDNFGEAVVVRGNIAVVGANGHTPNGVRFGGAAYVFVREGTTWTQGSKITADVPGKADRFGDSVAIGGSTVVIGAPFVDTERGGDVGAAYVFVPDGDGWKQQAKLSIDGAKKGFNFGTGVATTGNIIIVGAPGYDDPARGSGAAYSFVRVDGVWQQKEKVTPKDGAKDIHFGQVIAMSENNTVAIGSHSGPFLNHDGKPNGDGHAAYIYNTIEAFGTPPFAVEPFGLRVTTLGQVKRTALYQNFPNPFNPETWLPYHLGDDMPVTLSIYNVQGQLTRELDLGTQKAGSYLTRETAAYWDGRDQVGETVSSGVYFYTLQTGAFQATRRMLVLK